MSTGTNIWNCGRCGTRIVADHKDEGVTPFMIDCVKCGDIAYSQFYSLSEADEQLEVEFEWYTPKGRQYRRLKVYDREHVDNGGLLMRRKTRPAPADAKGRRERRLQRNQRRTG